MSMGSILGRALDRSIDFAFQSRGQNGRQLTGHKYFQLSRCELVVSTETALEAALRLKARDRQCWKTKKLHTCELTLKCTRI